MMLGAGKSAARAPPLRRFAIDHSSAASTGVVAGVDVVAVEAEPASSRRLSRAPRPIGFTSVGQQRAGERLGRVAGHGDLEAVLAGVARAGDDAVGPRHDRARVHEAIAGDVGRNAAPARRAASVPATQSARGPQRLDARSRRESCARRCASSASLQAALTTSIRLRRRGSRTIRSSRMPPLVGEQRVALPAGREPDDVAAAPALPARARRRDVSGFGRSAIWPICETSNRPAAAARVQMLLEDAGRVLHRHLIARERHHLAAAARRCSAWSGVRCSARIGHRRHASYHGPAAQEQCPRQPVEAPSVMGPESITPSADARLPLRWASGAAAAFQMSSPLAVLLPESFRGGCSFGAGQLQGAPVSPDVTIKSDMGTRTRLSSTPVNATAASYQRIRCLEPASP